MLITFTLYTLFTFTGESITVHLKVTVNISEPPPVLDHDVPILIRDRVRPHHEWDLTTQQVRYTGTSIHCR